MLLKVGESRQEGMVVVTRTEEEKFEVACGACDYTYTSGKQAAADWVTFTHNRRFKKEGCNG